LDGLFDSIHRVGWTDNSLRFIFHIGDAPPHGKEYLNNGRDGFPEGCPCKYKIADLAF